MGTRCNGGARKGFDEKGSREAAKAQRVFKPTEYTELTGKIISRRDPEGAEIEGKSI
jgi:hypothetical protein